LVHVKAIRPGKEIAAREEIFFEILFVNLYLCNMKRTSNVFLKNIKEDTMKYMKLFVILTAVMVSLVFSADLAARVTKVHVSVNPTSFSGKCPKTFEFTGVIVSNSPGVVKYQWKRSDNATAPIKSITFRGPGKQVVKTTWTIGRSYTGWQSLLILAPNKMMSNKAHFKLKCGMKVERVKPVQGVQRIRPGQIRPGTIRRACPDPAAHEIRFQIVRRDSQFNGRVRITAIVKNVGGKAFASGPNQAAAHLYQMPAGATSGGTLVAQRNFQNLAPGATISVSYERDWRSSSPNEGEFPPTYRLLISYDPDIYMDDNKDNDDCNQNNNKKDRSGSGINDLFR
jgi:hypothetical protein